MSNAKTALPISLGLNIALAVVLVLTMASLIEERSIDRISLTVTSEELLPTIRGIQGATGQVMSAVPLGGEEDQAKYWRIEYREPTSIS